MSAVKLSLLLLSIALLAIPIYTHSIQASGQNGDDWSCSHSEQEDFEIVPTDTEEDYNPEGNNHEGRTLASYSNLRTMGYYGFLRTSVSYFQNDLIPPILDYFSAALKNKYAMNGPLKISSNTVCGKATPAALKQGVNADYVLMIETYSESSTVVAATQVCSYASGTRRPTVAYSKINSYRLKATTDVLLHEKNMVCIMHEVTHSLGFTSNMYSSFLDAAGRKQSGIVKSAVFAGYTTEVLTAEPLRTMLREHFGCPSLAGAYMENTGGSGTTAHHFERRIFSGFEYMTSGLIYQMQVTKFTLGLLESTGWYVPDYNLADEYHWGKDTGCSFISGTCSSTQFDEYCSGNVQRCTTVGRGGGSCQSDARSDGCKFIHPNINTDCENPVADNYARLPSAETYGRNTGSKCFEGTLSATSANAGQTTFCFKFVCSGTARDRRLTVRVGNSEAVCTQEGSISVEGYRGKIDCPDPNQYCETVGAGVCPRGCMGRGTCVDGFCQCKSGFKGRDCALRSAF